MENVDYSNGNSYGSGSGYNVGGCSDFGYGDRYGISCGYDNCMGKG